jgi:hypothetical protein
MKRGLQPSIPVILRSTYGARENTDRQTMENLDETPVDDKKWRENITQSLNFG